MSVEITLPWMSFGSDEAAPAPEGVFLLSNNHPRAYGNFARLLGHYVLRHPRHLSSSEAVRRLTSSAGPTPIPEGLGGAAAKPGYFADIMPPLIPRRSVTTPTHAAPAPKLATGMADVLVGAC